jgi:glutathione S-transferase
MCPAPRAATRLLEKAGGSYFVGSEPSIADITFWELLDTHLRIYEEQFKAHVGGALLAQLAAVAVLH